MPGAGRPSRRPRAPGPRDTERERLGHRAVPPLSRAGTLHKAPTAPAPCGISAGPPRGLRSHTPATQCERKTKNSSHLTGAEELGGSWHCLGFPQLQTPATETTLYAERSLQTPRPGSRDERRGWAGRGRDGEGPPGQGLAPAPLSFSDWPELRLLLAWEEGLWAVLQTPGSYPGNGERLPRPAPTWSKWIRPGNFAQDFPPRA